MAGEKYWENEDPEIFRFGKNEFRYYPQAGKLQVYPLAPNTPHGVGRGATIDLSAMTPDEVGELREKLDAVMTDSMDDEI